MLPSLISFLRGARTLCGSVEPRANEVGRSNVLSAQRLITAAPMLPWLPHKPNSRYSKATTIRTMAFAAYPHHRPILTQTRPRLYPGRNGASSADDMLKRRSTVRLPSGRAGRPASACDEHTGR